MQRADDFLDRRRHLAELSDEELDRRFWQLAEQIVQPLVDLARTHTTPSIERSVLLRMGFNSLEAQEIVKQCSDRGLLAKGAGHAVWRAAQRHGLDILTAGRQLAAGRLWEDLFAGGDAHGR